MELKSIENNNKNDEKGQVSKSFGFQTILNIFTWSLCLQVAVAHGTSQ